MNKIQMAQIMIDELEKWRPGAGGVVVDVKPKELLEVAILLDNGKTITVNGLYAYKLKCCDNEKDLRD